jgi:hypothetical protein
MKRKNLMKRLDRTDFRNKTTYIEGRTEAEHFRLCVEITDTLTEEAVDVINLFKDGLYIVNPKYNWSKCKDTINTENIGYERFLYVETAEINCKERLIIFSNGDGWGYLVDFDDVVGVAYVPAGDRMKAVILTTYGEWVRDI